ncbi:MAG: helix-turn-helix domain-containing protein [Clostridium sp.]|nr:helix-turn-helix domain-containing protein [Clostridium sp.]MCM1208303.1 helix-turn-helix domain-containing protein [Ruminococcus sp.]
MYEIFQKLLKNAGLKPSDVTKATGIASSTLTDWKMGRSTPKQDKMQQIADFLGVSLTYLMTGKEKEKPNYEGQVELWLKIRHDDKMLSALEKFYNLSDKKKAYVLELIDLLGQKI